jgi:hypothetical protein
MNPLNHHDWELFSSGANHSVAVHKTTPVCFNHQISTQSQVGDPQRMFGFMSFPQFQRILASDEKRANLKHLLPGSPK